MDYNSLVHKRKTIRLKDYNYSLKWLYFITICTNKKICLFWEIIDWEMKLSPWWEIIKNCWNNLINRHNNIKLHNYIIMPNHFHGIIEIVNDLKGTHKGHPYRKNDKTNVGAIPCGCPDSDECGCPDLIWNIIWWFKSITTNEYIKNVKSNKWKPFYQKLWQRNYYEHIIRNEESFLKIYEYIDNNISKWNEDELYIKEI